MLSSDHKQKLGVEARGAKIQQMYENMELHLDLKLSFMITGAYYKSSLWARTSFTRYWCSVRPASISIRGNYRNDLVPKGGFEGAM